MAFPTASGDPKLCGGIWGFGVFDNGDEAKVKAANAADCEFNRVDFMHLTRKGHAQLADLLAKEVPTLL